jgi:hypothetical protein
MKRKFEVRSPKPEGRLACESRKQNPRILPLPAFLERPFAASVANQ